MGKVLGLSFFFHDSAAALVVDGGIVAAAAEERFCRRKHTNEFPKRAIEYCLEAGGLSSIEDLDAIVFYEKPVTKLMRVVETLTQVWPFGLTVFSRRLPGFLSEKVNVYRAIEQHLPGYSGEIFFADHHLSHAASAFYCSPFEEAAILTIDGVGEWETTTMGVGRRPKIELQRSLHFPHSIGLLYSALTGYLGFRVNDGEWKVMGLAPYGEPRFVNAFHKLVDLKQDGSFRLNMEYFAHHYSSRFTARNDRWERLFGFPPRDSKDEIEQCHEDLARSGQAVVEEMILGLAREARRVSGSENLVIAGGVGLNSVANWKIEAQGIFRNVWIQPAAGDDGGALGAALLVSQTLLGDPATPTMTHAYYGPEFAAPEIEAFLQRRGIPFQRFDETALVAHVADLIAAGKVVGWFRGRMEFGPRALGSRSILADATNPEMKAIINRKIKYREYFRPFAPAVPLENVHEYFDVEPGRDLPFMLKVPAVRAEMKVRIPAVTHEDGTGRVQTVTEAVNPAYYHLLKAVGKRTGTPVVLNTSFNVRGEPIVCTPAEAYDCFVSTGIDALVLGDFLVTEKPVDGTDHEQGFARSDALEDGLDDDATILAIVPRGGARHEDKTTGRVLGFYQELPFNYYSNAADTAIELMRANRLKEYPVLDAELTRRENCSVLDVGCGAGWFVLSCAHHYGHRTTGVDINQVALRQARNVARFMPSGGARFVEANLFELEPGERFDIVNSLGVLHHTSDCPAAVKRAAAWVAPGGWFHLGLYHLYGRRPFLEHFKSMQERGSTDATLYQEFARLTPDITDETHRQSWFRDQVLHPHETQHTLAEAKRWLSEVGFEIVATSLNGFRPLVSLDAVIEQEQHQESLARTALAAGRYFPGFYVVWARRQSEPRPQLQGE